MMRRFLQLLPALLFVTGALLLAERPAYAYTDPGTGLLAIQAVGSMLVAAGWYLRRKLYLLFHRVKPEAQPSDGEGPGLP